MKKIERRLEALEDEAKPPAGRWKIKSYQDLDRWVEAGGRVEDLDLSETPESLLRQMHEELTAAKARLEDAQGEAEP